MCFLKEMRKDVREAQFKYLEKELRRRIEKQCNRGIGVESEEPREVAYQVLEEIKKQTEAKLNAVLDDLDIKNNAVVYVANGKIVIGVFLNTIDEMKEVEEKHLEDNPKFQDYHYDNRTDPWYDFAYDAGELTDEEYKAAEIDYAERKEFYDEVFGECVTTPAEAGLNYNFMGSTYDIHAVKQRFFKNVILPMENKV